MVDIAYGGTRVDTSEAIDSQNFLETTDISAMLLILGVEKGNHRIQTI